MTRTLFIHTGPAKTGTSAVQHLLRDLDDPKLVYLKAGQVLEVTPGPKGIANIYDKDILIFAISQIMAARNEGRPYSRENQFQAQDFLEFSNRHTGGHDYDLLRDSLDRLDSTRLRTTIKTGGEETWEAFGLIEGAKIKRKRQDGRVTEWGLKLSEWLFKAIEANEVLTVNGGAILGHGSGSVVLSRAA